MIQFGEALSTLIDMGTRAHLFSGTGQPTRVQAAGESGAGLLENDGVE